MFNWFINIVKQAKKKNNKKQKPAKQEEPKQPSKYEGKLAKDIVPVVFQEQFEKVIDSPALDEPAIQGFDYLTKRDIANSAVEQDKNPQALNRPDFATLRLTLGNIYGKDTEAATQLDFAVRAALYDYAARFSYLQVLKSSLAKELGEDVATKILGDSNTSLDSLTKRLHLVKEKPNTPIFKEILSTLDKAQKTQDLGDTADLQGADLAKEDPKFETKLVESIIKDHPEIDAYTNGKGRLEMMVHEILFGKKVQATDNQGKDLMNLAQEAIAKILEPRNNEFETSIEDLKQQLGEVLLKSFKASTGGQEFLTLNNLVKTHVNQQDEVPESSLPKNDSDEDGKQPIDESQKSMNEQPAPEPHPDFKEQNLEGAEFGDSKQSKQLLFKALTTKGADDEPIIKSDIVRLALYQYLVKHHSTSYTYTEDASTDKADILTDDRIDEIITKVSPYLSKDLVDEIKNYKNSRNNFAKAIKTTPVQTHRLEHVYNTYKKELAKQKKDDPNAEFIEEKAIKALRSLINDQGTVTGEKLDQIQTELRQLLSISNRSTYSNKGIGAVYNRELAECAKDEKYIHQQYATLKTADQPSKEDAQKVLNLCIEKLAKIDDLKKGIEAKEQVTKRRGTLYKLREYKQRMDVVYNRIKAVWTDTASIAGMDPAKFDNELKKAHATPTQKQTSTFNTEEDFYKEHSKIADALGITRNKSKNNPEGSSSPSYEVVKSMVNLLDDLKDEQSKIAEDISTVNGLLLPNQALVKNELNKTILKKDKELADSKKSADEKKTAVRDYLIQQVGPTGRMAIARVMRSWQAGDSADKLIELLNHELTVEPAQKQEILSKINKEDLSKHVDAINETNMSGARSEQEKYHLENYLSKLLQELYTDQNIQLNRANASKPGYKSEHKIDNPFAKSARAWNTKLQQSMLETLYNEYKGVKTNIENSQAEKTKQAVNASQDKKQLQDFLAYVNEPESIITHFKQLDNSASRGKFLKDLYRNLSELYQYLFDNNCKQLGTQVQAPFYKLCAYKIRKAKEAQNQANKEQKEHGMMNTVIKPTDILPAMINETPFEGMGAVVVNQVEELAETIKEQKKEQKEKSDGIPPEVNEFYPAFPKGSYTVTDSGAYLYSETPEKKSTLKSIPDTTEDLVLDPKLLNPKYVNVDAGNKDLMFDMERSLLFTVKYYGDLIPEEDDRFFQFDPNASGKIVSCLGHFDLPTKEEKQEEPEVKEPEQTEEQQEEQKEEPVEQDYQPTEEENNLSKEQGFNFFGLNKQAADEELPYTQNTYEVSQSEGVGYNPGAEKSLANQETDKHFSMSKLGQLIKNAMRTNPDFFKTVESIVRQSEIPNPDDVITFLQCLIKAGGEATAAIRLYNAQASEPKERSYFWHLIKTHVWPILRKDSAIKDVAEQLNDQDIVE